jgi:hypothetical protein
VSRLGHIDFSLRSLLSLLTPTTSNFTLTFALQSFL